MTSERNWISMVIVDESRERGTERERERKREKCQREFLLKAYQQNARKLN